VVFLKEFVLVDGLANDRAQDAKHFIDRNLSGPGGDVSRPERGGALLPGNGVEIPTWHHDAADPVKLPNRLADLLPGLLDKPPILMFRQRLEDRPSRRGGHRTDVLFNPGDGLDCGGGSKSGLLFKRKNWGGGYVVHGRFSNGQWWRQGERRRAYPKSELVG